MRDAPGSFYLGRNSEPNELVCCDDAEHEGLLADLERDALVDPDVHEIIYAARRQLRVPAAEVPWWAT